MAKPSTSAAEGKKAAAKKLAPFTVTEKLNAIGIEAICDHVEAGESLRSWAKKNGFAQQTVLDWIAADEDRAGHYARARDARADAVFDELDDLTDQAVRAESAVEVAGLRLKVDTIKWKLGKMSPKKYGDRIVQEHTGPDGEPIKIKLAGLSDAELAAMEALMTKAQQAAS